MPDWLTFILLSVAWAPVLVLLHDAAHAFAALALSDGDVPIRGGPRRRRSWSQRCSGSHGSRADRVR